MDYSTSTKFKVGLPSTKIGVSILALAIVVSTTYVHAQSTDYTVTISAVVPSSSTNTSGGGGGGGGGSNGSGGGGGGGGGGTSGDETLQVTTVSFSGTAYPGANISLYQDAKIINQVTASSQSAFQTSVTVPGAGTYNFAIRAKDQAGRVSAIQPYSIVVPVAATTVVQGVVFPPTISIDKSEVKYGDLLKVSGQVMAGMVVSVVIQSAVQSSNQGAVVIPVAKVSSDSTGAWSYNLSSSKLSYGNYQVHVQAANSTITTPFSTNLTFAVGAVNVENQVLKQTFPATLDLNNDSKIDLQDFSILAYYYGKKVFPANVDFNHDGKIDLADFSILAYYWTG